MCSLVFPHQRRFNDIGLDLKLIGRDLQRLVSGEARRGLVFGRVTEEMSNSSPKYILRKTR